jgi:hypothetical protein
MSYSSPGIRETQERFLLLSLESCPVPVLTPDTDSHHQTAMAHTHT